MLEAKNAISDAIFYNWSAKFGAIQVSDFKRMRELEQENSLLDCRMLTWVRTTGF